MYEEVENCEGDTKTLRNKLICGCHQQHKCLFGKQAPCSIATLMTQKHQVFSGSPLGMKNWRDIKVFAMQKVLKSPNKKFPGRFLAFS